MKRTLCGLLLFLASAWLVSCQRQPPVAANSNAVPSNTVLPSSPETVNVVVFREIDGAKQETVPPNTIFTSGQAVRLGISTAEPGYLYLLLKGSSGQTLQLFPDKNINQGKSEIEAHRQLMIPALDRVFRFDKSAGTETLYIVFSTTAPGPRLPGGFAEQAAYLDTLAQAGKSDAVTTAQGALVRIVRLEHK